MRGVGFIWSPLLNSTARVSTQMMHIQDWVPTILGAVGVKMQNTSLDGVDLWEALNDPDTASPRTEFLHNIDENYGNEAIRHGEWKLMHGKDHSLISHFPCFIIEFLCIGTTYGGQWDNWYGPSGFERDALKGKESTKTSATYSDIVNSDTGKAIQKLGPHQVTLNASKVEQLQRQARVVCNPPKTKTTTCTLKTGEYCLFNIEKDPCEFNNLAKSRPDIVKQLQQLLAQYKETAVTPRNVPKDPRGQPKHWHYTWTNWMDFLDKE